MSDVTSSPDIGFLLGDGECAGLILAKDWSDTLGPVGEWPPSLKVATGLLLRSPVPMVMLWGEDGIMIYNDAYSVFAGGRHPQLLGSKVREGWPEVADFNDHVMKVGLEGETLSYKDQELTLNRHGRPEQVWMNLDYSPVLDERGKPAGVLAIVVETTDTVRAERQNRESEARLRATLDGMNEGLLVLDHDFRVIDMNAQGERMDRRPRAELLGRHHDEIYPDAGPEVMALYRRVMETREPGALHHRYTWPTGGESWLSLRAFPIAEGVAAFYRDTTAETKANLELRESEERLRLVVDGATDYAILTFDPERRITGWSKGAENVLGFTREEAIGQMGDIIFTPDDRAMGQPAIEAAKATAEGCAEDKRWHVRADGRRVYLNGSTHLLPPDANGRERGFIKIARDETERRLADRQLEVSESRLRASLEASQAGTFHWNIQTNELEWDEPLNKLFGVDPRTTARSLDQFIALVHEDDRAKVVRACETCAESGADFSEEFRIIRPDGAERWLYDRGKTHRDAQGQPATMTGACVDITERKGAEAALAESERTLRSVLEQLPVGVILASTPDGEIIFYNEAADTILGSRLMPEAAASYDQYGGIHDDGSALAASEYPLARTVNTGETIIEFPMRYRRPDGEIVHLEINSGLTLKADQTPDLAICVFADVTARKRAEQHQQLLIDELSHRAKNVLAIVQSVAQQSFKGHGGVADMVGAFEGRLGALAAAHGILTRQKWESAPIRQIIGDTVTAVEPNSERLNLGGPDLMVSPKTGVSLAMAVHELATNALKYGSLSNETGTVDVQWAVHDGRLRFEWKERGGPQVHAPSRRGFGSRMIERGLAAELGGEVRIEFQPEGVTCTLDAPLPEAG